MTSKAFELAQLGDAVAVDGSGGVTIATSGSGDALTITSTDAGDTFAPDINFYRNSSSPADNDGTGLINFRGRNDNSQDVNYVQIQTTCPDVSDGAEDGFFSINTMVNGSLGDRISIDASGQVGIGTSSGLTRELTVKKNDQCDVSIVAATNQSAQLLFGDTDADNRGIIQYDNGSDFMAFTVAGSERMRLASTGDLRVGKTSTLLADVGHELDSTGYAYITRDGGNPLYLNRKTNTGNFIQFYKDTNYVGSIGTVSDDIYFAGPDNNHAALRFAANNRAVLPVNSGGALSDNNTNLGQGTARFDDIYATNSSIQTSDQNEKQQIASLTGAEITAAKAISQLFKTYKWNSSVESKGDNARTHTGVIAQEVETAMSDAGLDAGNYAFFISNTWWETSTEVAAVEADEENGIVAQEAYTRIDTYNTSEEAPEGAVERNRKGIRYPELLSFIGAATEQRLTSIEARLDALETE